MKFKIYLFVLLFSLSFLQGNAQDSLNKLKVSLLTCGPGQDLYSGFGHSGVRIIENNDPHQDLVYNYGTFDFGDPDFYSKFTRGKLLYYVNIETFRDFISTYEREGRSVYEQVLQLNTQQALRLKNFLDSNAQDQYKYYNYDFLYDNCSTRILDIFKSSFGSSFVAGLATASDSLSFRDRTDYYLRNNHWTLFGINLLLSTPVDKKMSNEQSMFLPDYLMKGIGNAQLNGQPFVSQTLELLPNTLDFRDTPNTVKIVLWLFAIIVFLLSFTIKHSGKMIYFDTLFFLLIGLLGCFMLFMWFGTDHQSCGYNRNLLWALPTHLIFAFFIPRKASWLQRYAQIALGILLFALVWNLFAAQVYIAELTPIILLLLWRLNHYRKNRHNHNPYEQFRNIFTQFRSGKVF